MIYWILWAVFSLLLLGFSLARPHPYRLPRFLAFESIMSLVFLNARRWFSDPFSPLGITSWILLAGSALLAGHGFYLIKTSGEPQGDLEETTRLITRGAYRYIRHPLYGSLLLLAGGVYLKDPSSLGVVLLGSTLLGVLATARSEEEHNLERFGEEYRTYMDGTKRFIPFIY